ncbi:MAG TPA: lamin tail domain-containing protein [Phycisphaerae bacterium]
MLAAAAIGARALRGEVVISEVLLAPTANSTTGQWIELYNNGPYTVDLTTWWVCIQPSSFYFRLLEVPQHCPGIPLTPGIMLGAGEYLTIRWDQGVNGNYSTGPSPGDPSVIVHEVWADPCCPTPPETTCTPTPGDSPLPAAGNASLFQILINTPSFGFWWTMRDFVEWSPTGSYQGAARASVAIQAHLWPWGPGNGDDLITVAVNTQTIAPESGLSIQYNGGLENNPSDYYIAPATYSAPNTPVPFDLDGDGDVDLDEYHLLAGCMTGDGGGTACRLLDSNGDSTVDLFDFALFQQMFTGDYAP